jgi:P4 family phage/plasmid primase-like protien
MLTAGQQDWIDRARAADILAVAQRPPLSAKLKKHNREWIGPCPACGGTDRFAINPRKKGGLFNCRSSGGGDVIAMVMHAIGVEFLPACEIINGEPMPAAGSRVSAAEIDAAVAKREAERARRDAEREAESNRCRERERKTARAIYDAGVPIAGTAGEAYFALRGIMELPAGPELRYGDKIPYFHGTERNEVGHDVPRAIWRGPAVLAPIVDGAGAFIGVHITWIDLELPNGKASINDPDTGEPLDVKKVRGSQSGGVIRLSWPDTFSELVTGEGVETTLSVWFARHRTGEPLAGVAFAAAINLGNLAGRAADSVPHPTHKTDKGRVARVPGPVPDLTAPGLPLPAGVDRVLILGDGDSDAFTTQCAIARAGARIVHAGAMAAVAWAPGGDFNDVLRSRGVDGVLELLRAEAAPAAPEIPSRDAAKKPSARRKPRPMRPSSSDQADSNPHPPDPPTAGAVADAAAPPRAPAALKNASSQMGGSSRQAAGAGGDGANAEIWPDPAYDQQKLDEQLAFYPLTDLGNAERFRDRNRHRFLWCPALGWLYWDGKRWNRDGADDRVKAAEHETVRSIQNEAKSIRGTARDQLLGVKKAYGAEMAWHMSDAIAAHGRQSEQNNRLTPIAKRAAPYLAITPGELDADPLKFNVANGTLVFRRRGAGEEGDCVSFRPHNPADRITKCSPVVYDPTAAAPVFDDFFSYVQPDAPTRRFLLQWQGLSLTGDVSDQKLATFWGKGKNGKSTFIDVCAFVGGDYSETVPIETFLNEGRGRNAGQATPDLAILPGVRFLRTSEPDRGAKLAEALIKLATGGEPIQARHLNRDYFKFYPQFKLTISGNYRPTIAGADEGIWRRVQLVPWTITVPEEKRDPHLAEKLRAEASGILNRLLDGLRDWLDHGLIAPQSVIQATADYRRDSDPLGRFLEDCTAPSPTDRVQSTTLHQLFCAWAKANGEREWSNKGMSSALVERGLARTKSGVVYWSGIRLTRSVNDFVDHEGRPLAGDSRPVKDEEDDIVPS